MTPTGQQGRTGRGVGRGADLDELAALEEQRRFLLTSLADLEAEHEAGDLDDDDYETLRADYTVRAARVLDAIEDQQELIDTTGPEDRGLRRAIAVIAVVVVAVVAGVVVTSVSGSSRTTAKSGASLEPTSETQACIEQMGVTFGAATQDGSSFASNAVATLECFTERLDDEPDDVVALTYRGRTEALLAQQLDGVAAASDVENFARRARADLSRALELDPEFPDALAFAALEALAQGELDSARDLLERIDRLQLPADNAVLPIVNNVVRPALDGTGASTTVPGDGGTTVPPTGAPTTAPTTPAPAD